MRVPNKRPHIDSVKDQDVEDAICPICNDPRHKDSINNISIGGGGGDTNSENWLLLSRKNRTRANVISQSEQIAQVRLPNAICYGDCCVN